jgi:TPR repeat protein/serine/threonine protein kinase
VSARKPPVFQAGETIAKRYVVFKKVSGSERFTLCEARNVGSQQWVILKLFEGSQDEEQIVHFKTTVQQVAALHHPNVSRVLDHGVVPKQRYYVVYERLEGQFLSDVLRDGPLPIADAERLMGEVALALAAAHELNVIHGGLRPESIFINNSGVGRHAHVQDFGFARIVDIQELDDYAHRLAPELLEGGEPSASSDVFAWALCTLEAILGKAPLNARGRSAVREALPKLTLESFRQLEKLERPSDKKSPLLPVLQQALALDPKQRFLSAEALAKALGLDPGANKRGGFIRERTRPVTLIPEPATKKSGEQAKRQIDKKSGEQAKRQIDKKSGEQAKRQIDKKSGEQAKRQIDKKASPPTVPVPAVQSTPSPLSGLFDTDSSAPEPPQSASTDNPDENAWALLEEEIDANDLDDLDEPPLNIDFLPRPATPPPFRGLITLHQPEPSPAPASNAQSKPTPVATPALLEAKLQAREAAPVPSKTAASDAKSPSPKSAPGAVQSAGNTSVTPGKQHPRQEEGARTTGIEASAAPAAAQAETAQPEAVTAPETKLAPEQPIGAAPAADDDEAAPASLEADVSAPSSSHQELGGTGQAPNPQELGGTGQAPNPQELGGTGQAPNPQELGGTGQAPNPQELGGTGQAPNGQEHNEPEQAQAATPPPARESSSPALPGASLEPQSTTNAAAIAHPFATAADAQPSTQPDQASAEGAQLLVASAAPSEATPLRRQRPVWPFILIAALVAAAVGVGVWQPWSVETTQESASNTTTEPRHDPAADASGASDTSPAEARPDEADVQEAAGELQSSDTVEEASPPEEELSATPQDAATPPPDNSGPAVERALAFLSPDFSKRDETQARSLLESACANGDRNACLHQAQALRDGVGAPADAKAAYALVESLCTPEENTGCSMQAQMLYTGTGTSRNLKRAAELAETACEAGAAPACVQIATQLLKGRGVKRDGDRAQQMLEEQCSAKQGAACSELAMALHKGRGMSKDVERALTLFNDACEYGAAEACAELADIYRKGEGVEKDGEKYVQHLAMACSAGLVEHCSDACYKYQFGDGVSQDQQEALKLCELGCAGGELKSCERAIQLARSLSLPEARFQAYDLKMCWLGKKKACPATP